MIVWDIGWSRVIGCCCFNFSWYLSGWPGPVCSGQNLSNYNLWSVCSIKLFGLGSSGTSHESHILFLKIKILFANIWWGSWCWCQEVDITMCRVSQSYHIITAICKHSGWCEHFCGDGIFGKEYLLEWFNVSAALRSCHESGVMLQFSSQAPLSST